MSLNRTNEGIIRNSSSASRGLLQTGVDTLIRMKRIEGPFHVEQSRPVELIVAQTVLLMSDTLPAEKILTEPLLTQSQFTCIILMAFVTTLLAPIALRLIVLPLVLGIRRGLLRSLAGFR